MGSPLRHPGSGREIRKTKWGNWRELRDEGKHRVMALLI
jgi:hypothetical protein